MSARRVDVEVYVIPRQPCDDVLSSVNDNLDSDQLIAKTAEAHSVFGDRPLNGRGLSPKPLAMNRDKSVKFMLKSLNVAGSVDNVSP